MRGTQLGQSTVCDPRFQKATEKVPSDTRRPDLSLCPTMHATRDGEWLPAEDLLAHARQRLTGCSPAETVADPGECLADMNQDIVLDLSGVNHLDASALQVLMAIGREQRLRGHKMWLLNSSAELKEWFGYAGALGLLDT